MCLSTVLPPPVLLFLSSPPPFFFHSSWFFQHFHYQCCWSLGHFLCQLPILDASGCLVHFHFHPAEKTDFPPCGSGPCVPVCLFVCLRFSIVNGPAQPILLVLGLQRASSLPWQRNFKIVLKQSTESWQKQFSQKTRGLLHQQFWIPLESHLLWGRLFIQPLPPELLWLLPWGKNYRDCSSLKDWG